MSKYIYIGLKKTCLGCFRYRRRYMTKAMKQVLEGGGIETETTVLSIYAMHALFRFCVLLT